MNKILRGSLFLLLLSMCLFLGGCTGVLYPLDQVEAIDLDTSQEASIDEFHIVNAGIVQDESTDGDRILSISANNRALDMYDTSTANLVNIVNSDSELGSARFTGLGLYYTKLISSNNYAENLYQLMWYSLDKSEERTITEGDKSCTGVFSAYGEDGAVYVQSGNLLIVTNSLEEVWSYQLDTSLSVIKVRYSEAGDQIFMLASESDQDYNALYVITRYDSGRITIEKIASNILDFDYSETLRQLAFIRQSEYSEGIFTCTTDGTISRPESRLADLFTAISYTKDGEYLLFTKPASNDSSSCQSIWIASSDFKSILQLTSPCEITSTIQSVSWEDSVYFSCADDYLLRNLSQPKGSSYLCILDYHTSSTDDA